MQGAALCSRMRSQGEHGALRGAQRQKGERAFAKAATLIPWGEGRASASCALGTSGSSGP